MILAILGLLSTIFTLANTVIEKFFPQSHVPTFKKAAKTMVGIPQTWTADQIAKWGRKKGIVR